MPSMGYIEARCPIFASEWLSTPVAEEGEEGGRLRLRAGSPSAPKTDRVVELLRSSDEHKRRFAGSGLTNTEVLGGGIAPPWPGWCSWYLTGKAPGTGMSGRSNAGADREEVRELARWLAKRARTAHRYGLTTVDIFNGANFLNPGRADVFNPKRQQILTGPSPVPAAPPPR